MKIAIADIVIPKKRKRELGDFSALAKSMELLGQLNPIVITSDNRLVAGLHRINAAKSLGWTTIECSRITFAELDAELAEIDENLIRNELTVLERAEHLKRRKEIYEAKNPETKKGAKGGWHNNKTANLESEIISFSRDAAQATKTTKRTVEQDVKIATDIPEEVKEKLKDTPVADRKVDLLKISRMDKEEQEKVAEKIAEGAPSVKEAKKQIHREEKTPTKEETKKASANWTLHCVECKAVQLAPNSIDVIITDPPYPREFLSCYSDLAELAARVLRPGGSCIVMTGQSYLPEIIERMSKHLQYHWTLSYLTPGGQAVQLWDRKVNTFWKPLLWFIKPPFNTKDWQGDVLNSKTNDNDKRFHDWGQSESGMASIVDRFSYPGQTVLDPFVGAATTGVVAVKLGRQFIGVDIDPKQIRIARQRLEECN